jgi:hypothetical protein
MTDDAWRGGLAPHYDFMLPGRPDDPAMRESASIWLFADDGSFAFPRNGIEAVGASWDHHRTDCNFAFADGRALFDVKMDAGSHSPIGPDGRATVLGSGGTRFECIEPYRKWRVSYAGDPIDTSTAAMIAGAVDPARRTALAYTVDLEMVTPCWVQDNTPERLTGKSDREMDDARSMGLGYRMEHLFRGSGELTVDGQTRAFTCTGNRIHRQSVRPLEGFRGHVWQAAVFPDGRAFGYIAYPPGADGSTYNEGYVCEGGVLYPATATAIPWLDAMVASGEDMACELAWERGTVRIEGSGMFNTFKWGIPEMPGFVLNQGGAHYTLDGMESFGMVERSVLRT